MLNASRSSNLNFDSNNETDVGSDTDSSFDLGDSNSFHFSSDDCVQNWQQNVSGTIQTTKYAHPLKTTTDTALSVQPGPSRLQCSTSHRGRPRKRARRAGPGRGRSVSLAQASSSSSPSPPPSSSASALLPPANWGFDPTKINQLPNFAATPGFDNSLDDDLNPYTFYKYFFDDTFLHLIKEETNRYAQQKITPNAKRYSIALMWKPCTIQELKLFLPS